MNFQFDFKFQSKQTTIVSFNITISYCEKGIDVDVESHCGKQLR